MLGLGLLGLILGLAAYRPAFAGEHDCDDFSDIDDLHGRTGIVVPLDEQGREVSPWKGAPVVMGADLKTPRDLLRFAGKPVVVIGAKFGGADFSGLSLADICFVDSDLSGSRWNKVSSTALAFQHVDLSRANLEGARLVAVQFQSSRLDEARAARANFSRALLNGGSLGGLDLRGADLTAFDLNCGERYCDVASPVDARGANLTKASLSAIDLGMWRFEGARIDDATVPLNATAAFEKAELTSSVLVSGFEMAFFKDENVTVRLSPAEWRTLVAAWTGQLPETPKRPGFASPPAPLSPQFKTGEEIVYADAELPISAPFRRTNLFRKLAPVIFYSAHSTLYVRVIDRQHVLARGQAIRRNFDECDLEERVYTLKRKTGWYGAPVGGDKTGRAGWEDVFRLSGDHAEIAPDHGPFNSSQFVGCGDEAFSPMSRIPSDPEILKWERPTNEAR